MISTAQIASFIVAVVGALLFWANPKRKVNRSVFVSSATVAAWLTCSHLAASNPEEGLFWLRRIHAISAFIPLSLWMVKESIVGTFEFRSSAWLRENALWFVSAIVLSLLPFTEFFIPSYSTKNNPINGLGYYVYYTGLIVQFGLLLWGTLRNIKNLSGARKLELQVWLFGGCVVATVIFVLIGLGDLTGDSIYRKLKPFAVLIFYAGTAYAITSNRIFDARQILLVGLNKLTLVILATVVAYAVHLFFTAIVSELSTVLITTASVLMVSGWLNNWLDQQFQFLPQGGAARQAAFAAAQRETKSGNLESSFMTLLKGWGQTEQAVILSGTQKAVTGSGIELDIESEAVRAMKVLRWATPERLTRERQTPERKRVADLLAEHRLGVLVIEEGAAVTVLIGVGVGASRRPYTYPQVTQLMELASIIQGGFERAHFSMKAQQAEQLATVGLLGASVAHEIRNPLVSIKTFVQLLPTHYQDPTFREKFFHLIGDEVGRIDQLTEQLLDLASPRTYTAQSIELHPLLTAGMELVAAKAAHRQVDLITDFKADPDRAFTDASAAKQVMLNLCFNAIQAVENHATTERWVRVATRNTTVGIELAVADSGPGISPEIRPRLFQPFQTTKSSGFGLGLAICSDILTNLQANITVDPHEPGRGATFRVTFPCQPLSS
jgi:signal transduction histidine kinase